MASSDSILCNVCETQSKTNAAVKWCFECEEAFCTECLKHHSSSKFERNHAPIDIENYRSLTSYILNIKPYCDEHGTKFQNYCTTHDCPCCSKCITNLHKKCDPLPSLEDVIQNVKTSTALIDIEERLENLKVFFAKLSLEKEMNISDLKSQKESVLAKIKTIRITLNQHFDNLEKDVIRSLSDTESIHRNRIQTISKEVEKNEQNVTELLDSLAKMKKFASDLQIFLGRQKLEEEVTEKEKMMGDISTDTQHIVFKANVAITTLQSSLTSIGHVSVESRPSDIQRIIPKVKQAQIITVRTNNFDNLNLAIQQSLDVRMSGSILGCALTQDGKAVFSNNLGKCLLIKDIHNSDEYTIEMSGGPYDIACIDNKTLAVTSGSDNVINIVDLEIRQVKKTIYDGICHGICLLNRKLVYSTYKDGIKEMELSNYNIKELNIGNLIHDEYVAARNNKIYCTNNRTSVVTCYNSDHSVAWEFQNPILKSPRGIIVDDRSNVYVGGQYSDNIVVISPDGEKCKEFKLKIKSPRTLYIDDRSKQILICGQYGPAGIFSITM